MTLPEVDEPLRLSSIGQALPLETCPLQLPCPRLLRMLQRLLTRNAFATAPLPQGLQGTGNIKAHRTAAQASSTTSRRSNARKGDKEKVTGVFGFIRDAKDATTRSSARARR